MTDWSEYFLTDIPFVAVPAIRIGSPDKRVNGKFFCEQLARKQLEEFVKLIRSDAFPYVFLRSTRTVLGNGKSAVMAAAYWRLVRDHKNMVWTTANTDPKLRYLLANLLDELVRAGHIAEIRKRLGGQITPEKIQSALAHRMQYGTQTISALNNILSAKDEELTYVYTNIRRRLPTETHPKLFGAILQLADALQMERFYLFIDQFEEFVWSHKSVSDREKLVNELNDLLREAGENSTIVVSTHPEAEAVLREGGQEFETFVKFESSGVNLPPFTSNEALTLIAFYLKEFRVQGFKRNELYPFSKEVVEYGANRMSMNARELMNSLRVAMVYGSMSKYPAIDVDFIKKNHGRVFGGLEDKVDDFLKGKWTYTIT